MVTRGSLPAHTVQKISLQLFLQRASLPSGWHPDSYSGSRGFKYRSRYWLSWLMILVAFFSPPDKCRFLSYPSQMIVLLNITQSIFRRRPSSVMLRRADWRNRDAYCRHHQGDGSLSREAVSTSQSSVSFYHRTWSNIPGDTRLHSRCSENLKSHLVCVVFLLCEYSRLCFELQDVAHSFIQPLYESAEL
jgi:hypothetical protein